MKTKPDAAPYRRVAQLLTERAATVGLEQKDVAEKLEVSTAAVSRWFSGQRFPDHPHPVGLRSLLRIDEHELNQAYDADRAERAARYPAFQVPADGDDSTPDRQEVEHHAPTGPGRWKFIAARYSKFRRVAYLAKDAGADDVELDAAADEHGLHKGEGMTEEEVEAAIERARRDRARMKERFGARPPPHQATGREATADDFKMPAPAKKSAAKKGTRRG